MKPNIVFIMTDQQRADLRKGEGYSLDTMPFLDEWASGGVDFARAYTPNPTCVPARISLFTGRYPESHRCRSNHNSSDVMYTKDLFDLLRGQGYETSVCGKNDSHHEDDEFDYSETSYHIGHDGSLRLGPEDEVFADFLDNTRHMEMHMPSPGGVTVQHPYRNVSSAFEFLDSRNENKPFFLWLSFAEPHNPYQVCEPYFDMFPPESLPAVNAGNEALGDKGYKFQWMRSIWERVLGGDIDKRIGRARSNYHGMLRLIDDQIRRFITGVEERGLTENTIFVFLSDHGDFVGEYGLIRKGPELPEVLARIPMIWKGPGIKTRGRVSDGCVNIVDIFPTLCDILGVDIPYGVQGKSILPLLTGRDIPEREFDVAYSESGFGGLYWDGNDALDVLAEGASRNYETIDCLNTWTQCGRVRMVRKGRFKIQVDMLGNGYLYDLEDDPHELKNLWDDPSHLADKTDMLTELMAASLRAVDPIPVPHRRYRVKIHPKGYWFQDYHADDCGVREVRISSNADKKALVSETQGMQSSAQLTDIALKIKKIYGDT